MTDAHQIDLRAAYRRVLCAEPGTDMARYGLLVFEDLMEKCQIFDDTFYAGQSDANAYVSGRRSIGIHILDTMGISGAGQARRLAEALQTVQAADIDIQEVADGGQN